MFARFGAGYRPLLDRVAPGTFEQAVADAGISFELEVPALLEWRFDEAEAERIAQQVLAVLGSTALGTRFGEAHRLLLEWFPDVAHGMQLQNAPGIAGALADSRAHHPIRSEYPLTRPRSS